jgi:hypothetical protein
MITLPNEGEYEIIDDYAKKVVATLNNYSKLYSIIIVTSSFSDALNGLRARVLLYKVPKGSAKQHVSFSSQSAKELVDTSPSSTTKEHEEAAF